MNTSPFDVTTVSQDSDFVLGQSINPGCIDMPFVVEEVLRAGRQDFGKTLKVEDLGIDDLCALEASLDEYEADVKSQIAEMRRKIDERAYTLDVTGQQLSLGVAA